jgi:hypothetical protein
MFTSRLSASKVHSSSCMRATATYCKNWETPTDTIQWVFRATVVVSQS